MNILDPWADFRLRVGVVVVVVTLAYMIHDISATVAVFGCLCQVNRFIE